MYSQTKQIELRTEIVRKQIVMDRLALPNERRPWALIAWGVLGVVACGWLCWWLS